MPQSPDPSSQGSLPALHPRPPSNTSSTNKFSPLFSSPHRPRSHPRRPRRRSVDSSRARANNPSFFEHDSTVFVDLDDGDGDGDVPSTATVTTSKMPQPLDGALHLRPGRRQALRIDQQDGPWTISVAENPHEPASYSLYVKTPTHNLTLTRTAREIADLHAKLRDAFPQAAAAPPPLPFDPAALPLPPKRKSAFLNTLSRLASPARAARVTSPPSSFHVTPAMSPSAMSPRIEADDPFAATTPTTTATTAETQSQTQSPDAASASAPTPTSADAEDFSAPTPQSPALSAYLTSVANDQLLRTARAWKRFVRVRTDDLESVRVERAIKRVRSDLAAHVGDGADAGARKEQRRRQSRFLEDGAGAEQAEAAPRENGHTQEETAATAMPAAVSSEEEIVPVENQEAEKPAPVAALAQEDEEDAAAPVTPVQPERPAIPRSQSADPDRAARVTLARAFAPSSASESSRADTTGDDSATGSSPAPRRQKNGIAGAAAAARRQKKVTVADFEMLRVLGKGCAGKVLLVRYRKAGELYALKAITKRHVLAHQELQHTLTEQAVLKRMAAEGRDPFVVRLHWSFHDKENLFLVMDFHPGGDLATQLARWGRLGRDRARFYAAEIVEGVEGLHAAGVIYRDLKPENILIAGDGHIVLTDFGLSKEFARRVAATTAPSTPSGTGRHTSFSSQQSGSTGGGSGANTPAQAPPYWMADDGGEQWARAAGADTTSTFCGTAEYLAPEVIQGLPYSYEVDWWSFGTMLYEMLTGITPFWADNHSDMYVRVLQDELQFPDDRAMDQDTKSLIRGLLQRNPVLRIKEPRIKRHPYFSMIDWSHVYYKRYIPPYIPPIDPSNASDTQNFDDTFLDMAPVINDGADDDEDVTDAATDTDRESTPGGSRSSSAVRPGAAAGADDDDDVFDGYSYKGRHSVIIDDGVVDEEDEDADAEVGSDDGSMLAALNGTVRAEAELEGTPEPKTPEARRPELPEEVVVAQPALAVDTNAAVAAAARTSAERARISPTRETLAAAQAAAAASNGPDIHRKETKAVPGPGAAAKPKRPRAARREKSGVPQLDADLSGGDDGTDADEARTVEAGADADEDDWDFVDPDADGARGEERNGARGTSLFARGVVDRYKLAVFRKGSGGGTGTPGVRSVSNTSVSASLESPKERRGRAGLPFRRTPKQFLRAKSPNSGTHTTGTASSRKSAASLGGASPSVRTPSASQSRTGSASANQSVSAASANQSRTAVGLASPSLRSKQSETSFGGAPSISDASVTDETAHGSHGSGGMATHDEADEAALGPEDTHKGASAGQQPKSGRKLKKYKEGAEKVLSLFTSPSQPR